jgi:spore germination protein GerM
MAARRKKRTSSKTGCLLWIAAFILLLVLFLVKFGDIRAAVQKTGFLDALNHVVSKPNTPTPSSPQPPKNEKPQGPSSVGPSLEPSVPSAPSTSSPAPTPQSAPSVPQEAVPTPLVPPQQEKKTRSAALYFVRIHDDGAISSQKVKRIIPISDSPIQDTLEILIQGPTESELRENLLSLIPSGTKLRGVSVRGSTAIVDFNDAFVYNRYGKEGYMAQLRQIVYTLTEFQNITDVQFLIEGKTRAFLTEGVALDKPWARASF